MGRESVNEKETMLTIRCSQKLLKELNVTPGGGEPQDGYLGGWHADLLRIERRKCVLITNDATLYSLFIPGLRKPEFERFGERCIYATPCMVLALSCLRSCSIQTAAITGAGPLPMTTGMSLSL